MFTWKADFSVAAFF